MSHPDSVSGAAAAGATELTVVLATDTAAGAVAATGALATTGALAGATIPAGVAAGTVAGAAAGIGVAAGAGVELLSASSRAGAASDAAILAGDATAAETTLGKVFAASVAEPLPEVFETVLTPGVAMVLGRGATASAETSSDSDATPAGKSDFDGSDFAVPLVD